MQELYQYQPSYATHAFTDIKSFSGKSVLLNTFTNLLEGSPSGMFEETDTATKPILLKSTDGKIPFLRIGEDFSMSQAAKIKRLHGNLSNSALVRNNLSSKMQTVILTTEISLPMAVC